MSNTYGFVTNGCDVVVVDCDDEPDFVVDDAKAEAAKLKTAVGATAVVVQRGAQFWVV